MAQDWPQSPATRGCSNFRVVESSRAANAEFALVQLSAAQAGQAGIDTQHVDVEVSIVQGTVGSAFSGSSSKS